MNNESIEQLRKNVFTEPITKEVRSNLIAYIQLLTVKAQVLDESERLSNKGHAIAMDICGALAFQNAEGVEHDGWLNEKDEPVLSKILKVSGVLDANPDNPEAWRQLVKLTHTLDR